MGMGFWGLPMVYRVVKYSHPDRGTKDKTMWRVKQMDNKTNTKHQVGEWERRVRVARLHRWYLEIVEDLKK